VIHAFTIDGEHLWRLERDRVGIGTVERDAFLASIRPDSMTDDERRRFEARWRTREIPRTTPEYRGFLIDDQARLWIETHPVPGADSVTWSVVDPSGAWLAVLRVPADLRVESIRDERITGVLHGQLDVQRAAVFDIMKSGS